jgi:hypothetical protein
MCGAAGVLAYTDTHVLLGYNQSKNRWESLGGVVENGEDPFTAACREFVEESCYIVCDIDSITKQMSDFYIEDQISNVQYRTYFLKLNTKNDNITTLYEILKNTKNIPACCVEMQQLKWFPKSVLCDGSLTHAIDSNSVRYIL